MNLEKLLSDQGVDPLSDRVNGAPLRALINSHLKRVGATPIDATTPSDRILEAIYSLDDETTRTTLLTRQVGEIKGIVNYKRMMSFSAVIATILVMGFFVWVIKGDRPLTSEEIDMVKTLGTSALDVIKSFGGN